jgi:hypothetical protein
MNTRLQTTIECIVFFYWCLKGCYTFGFQDFFFILFLLLLLRL